MEGRERKLEERTTGGRKDGWKKRNEGGKSDDKGKTRMSWKHGQEGMKGRRKEIKMQEREDGTDSGHM